VAVADARRAVTVYPDREWVAASGRQCRCGGCWRGCRPNHPPSQPHGGCESGDWALVLSSTRGREKHMRTKLAWMVGIACLAVAGRRRRVRPNLR
jgi:hypothetical protein